MTFVERWREERRVRALERLAERERLGGVSLHELENRQRRLLGDSCSVDSSARSLFARSGKKCLGVFLCYWLDEQEAVAWQRSKAFQHRVREKVMSAAARRFEVGWRVRGVSGAVLAEGLTEVLKGEEVA